MAGRPDDLEVEVTGAQGLAAVDLVVGGGRLDLVEHVHGAAGHLGRLHLGHAVLAHVLLHLVGEAAGRVVARGDEVGLALVHDDLAVRDLLEAAGHAVVVGMDVGDDELRDLRGVAAELPHAFLEGGVGDVGVPAAVDEHRVAAVLDQVGHDVGQPLGHAGGLLQLDAELLRLLVLVLGEGRKKLVDAIENLHAGSWQRWDKRGVTRSRESGSYGAARTHATPDDSGG